MTRLPLLLLLCLATGAAAEPGDGWSLRAARNSTPVAVLDGPGNIHNLAVFCLSGAPFLALVFREPPQPATLRVDFGFGATKFTATARREPTAGGAYVIDLRDQPLAKLLAGRDRSATLAIAGEDQGRISLAGSTNAIRAALETCQSV